jgi:hypothetical protein
MFPASMSPKRCHTGGKRRETKGQGLPRRIERLSCASLVGKADTKWLG